MSPFHDSSPATISALAAIFGSLVGALASSVSTWITQRHQDQRDLLAKRIFHRALIRMKIDCNPILDRIIQKYVEPPTDRNSSDWRLRDE
jgi:hypothetical protein